MPNPLTSVRIPNDHSVMGGQRRTLEKIMEDRYYAALYQQTKSLKLVTEAGFFDDGLPVINPQFSRHDEPANSTNAKHSSQAWRTAWMTTPVRKIQAALKIQPPTPREKLAVLVTTGGFAPLHQGHLDILDYTKASLEANGWRVVGGYLGPSHDHYVQTKDTTNRPQCATARVMACQQAIAHHPLWMVDPWESLVAPRDVNFTLVYDRIWRLLHRHWPEWASYPGTDDHLETSPLMAPIYVCGSDNGNFVRAFLSTGYAATVHREHHLQDEKSIAWQTQWTNLKADSAIQKAKDHIWLIDNPGDNQHLSSRAFRPDINAELDVTIYKPKSATDTAPVDVSSQIFFMPTWPHTDGHDPKPLYIVRDDISWSCKTWEPYFPDVDWLKLQRKFMGRLAYLLQTHLRSKDRPKPRILCLKLEPQTAQVWRTQRTQPCLNLDSCTHYLGGTDIHAGRWFWPAEAQERAVTWVARGKHPPLYLQLANLPAGDYCYIDDDVASGATLQYIQSSLPEGRQITHWLSLTDWSLALRSGHGYVHAAATGPWPRKITAEPAVQSKTFYDVVDARDFLLGAANGGLRVGLSNNQLGRVPYAAPYVDLASRAKIPWENQASFSRELWALNQWFWAQCSSEVQATLTLCEEDCRNFWMANGYALDTSLQTIATDHSIGLPEFISTGITLG